MKKAKNVEATVTENNNLDELFYNVHYLLDSNNTLHINVQYLLKTVEKLAKDVENIEVELHGYE